MLVIPFVVALLGDNPMQSEFTCHPGQGGKLFCQMCEVKGFDATSGSVPVRLGQDIDCVPDPHRSLEPEQGGQAEQGAGHVNGTSGESSNEDTQSVTHR